MEDWIPTEENKGYDELVTEENDFYKLEYQYKDNARSLTEKIMGYLASVDEDSTLYFTDNIPQEYLPVVGGTVVSNCCEQFPMGFMCRVESIEHTGGFYRISVSPAEIDDCFEDFNLDLDTDILTYSDLPEDVDSSESQIPATPEELAKTRSVSVDGKMRHRTRTFTRASMDNPEDEESVVIDWRMHDMIMNKEKKPVTRGLEDDYEEDVNEEKQENSDWNLLTVDASSVVGAAIQRKCKWLNQFEFGINYINQTKIKKIVELKKQREYTKTTSANGFKFSGLIGSGLQKKMPGSTVLDANSKSIQRQKEICRGFRDMIKGRKTLYNPEELTLPDKIMRGKVFEIPLGTLPFGFLIRIKPIVSVSIGVVMSGDIMVWTSKTTNVTEIVKGKKIQDTTKKENTPSNSVDVNVAGTLNASGGLELFLGIGKKVNSHDAAGVGVGISATFDLTANLWPKAELGTSNVGFSDNIFKLDFNIAVTGKILASFWGEINFTTWKYTVPITSMNFYPRVEVNPTLRTIEGEDKDGKYRMTTAKFKLKSYGFSCLGWRRQYYKPYLYVYENSLSAIPKVLPAKESVSKIEKGKDYTFEFKTYNLYSSYVAIPVLVFDNDDGEYQIEQYPENEFIVDDVLRPMIKLFTQKNSSKKYDYIYQRFGEYDKDYQRAEYECTMPFQIFNAPSIKKEWDDFGFEYKIKLEENGRQQVFDKSLYNSIKKSGTYWPSVTFFINKENVHPYFQGRLYYVPKGKDTSNRMNREYLDEKTSVNKLYLWEDYTFSSKGSGYRLENWLKMTPKYDGKVNYDWMEDGGAIYINNKL